jgi:outer membrane receptor protein involved in Fe transport
VANNRGAFIPTTIVLRQQPKWTANASIFYQYPGDLLGGRLSFNADLRYRSKFAEGEDVITGATSADARIALDDIGGTGVDAAVNVVNVFNKNYDFGTVGSAPLSLGYRTSLLAPPRTVSMSLRYRWGN